MPVNVQEFTRAIGDEPPPCIVLLCPAKAAPRAREATFEPLLAERAAERLVETYVDKDMRDLSYAVFYADETTPSEITLEARTVPFLTERRVVLVRNAERYDMAEKGAEPILAYLEAPSDSTLLILIASFIDKRKRFYKTVDKKGLIVECPQLNERAITPWIRNEVEGCGKTIEPAAVQEIFQRAGKHLNDVRNAISVVISYIGDAPTIREEDVVAACADVAEEEIWALTNAIAVSDSGAALTALHRLMDMGKHPDALLGTINWQLKNAYTVARGGNSARTLSTYAAKKVQPLADKFGVKKLIDAFALCTDTHFLIRSTGVDALLALELLVVKLAAPRSRPAGRASRA